MNFTIHTFFSNTCTLFSFMYGWCLVSLIMEVDLPVLYKVIACVWKKDKVNWEELLAGVTGSSISWFSRWKKGVTGVLCLSEEFLNVPLMGTRGCINYNPVLAIRQLGYPMKGAPSEETIMPFIA